MTATDRSPDVRGFRHEAFLYSGDDEFLDGLTRFVADGVARDDAVFVVVDAPKIDRLRTALAETASSVTFADMQDVGHNPAVIIQLWRDFVNTNADRGRGFRGVGEPVSPARSTAALSECHIHEALLNAAFEHEPDFWLLCPYDTAALAAADVASAVGNHPFVRDVRGRITTDATRLADADAALTSRLPAPPSSAETIPFDHDTIRSLRELVARRAVVAGVGDEGVAGMVLAVSEVATNTVVHGHGTGTASMWTAGGSFVCELHGPGRITDPLVGRLRPTPGQMHGYGIWLANQVCDLVQIRSDATGTTVRLHLSLTRGRADAR